MIETWLKHGIIEKCLTEFIEKVFINFNVFKPNLVNYEVGDSMDLRLFIKNKSVMLHRCTITVKNDDHTLIICEDFEKPMWFVWRNGSIDSILGVSSQLINYLIK